MSAFMVGTPQTVLKYFCTFSGAISYWNYMVLGPGRIELQNLGIDPEGIEMYDLVFTDEHDPEFMKYIGDQNELHRERRKSELQESFDEVLDGSGQEQGNDSKILVETTSDSTASAKSSTGRVIRNVANKIKHDTRVSCREVDKEHKTS